jgi:uncharacterized RDD family membrane protein YckC
MHALEYNTVGDSMKFSISAVLKDFKIQINMFKRIAAMIYDALLLFGLLMLSTALLLPFNGWQSIPAGTFVHQIYLLVVTYLYFDYCWRHGGQTLGMKAWKFRCLGATDHRHTFLRFLGGLLSFLTLGLGFLLDWPGKWSGTKIVGARHASS